MKNWSDLRMVETIFEEETEDLQSLTSSPPLSPPLSSPSSPLQSAVDDWTATTGKKPDVKIYVQGICFHLHKDALMSESSYLKRQLTGVSQFTLCPPLKITADTFKQVADFCYSGHAVITPFNIAALTTAAELLKMNGDCESIDGGYDGGSLRERTECYFRQVVAVNRDFACSVFRSCLTLLPEVEQTAFLASRCVEAIFTLDESDGDGDGDGEGNGFMSCAEELKRVSPEDFRVIADSMQRRFTRSHDLFYRVVDLYFLVYNGKITEEQKTQICSYIDCSILSSPLLMHAVQNPRMPLRFIVQAMLIEQLNTHRSIFSALNTATTIAPAPPTTKPRPHQNARATTTTDSPATLGAILERDAALRQVAQLRAAINTTSSKIRSLEREFSSMKTLLADSEKQKQRSLLLLEQQPGRSSSCRFSTNNSNNNNDNVSAKKVERGERGSISASMWRFGDGKVGSSSCLERKQTQNTKLVKKNFGQKLIMGLKTAFGVSSKLKDGKLDRVSNGKEVQKGVVSGENGLSTIVLQGFVDNGSPPYRSHSVS